MWALVQFVGAVFALSHERAADFELDVAWRKLGDDVRVALPRPYAERTRRFA